jgi:hypothetical protein
MTKLFSKRQKKGLAKGFGQVSKDVVYLRSARKKKIKPKAKFKKSGGINLNPKKSIYKKRRFFDLF